MDDPSRGRGRRRHRGTDPYPQSNVYNSMPASQQSQQPQHPFYPPPVNPQYTVQPSPQYPPQTPYQPQHASPSYPQYPPISQYSRHRAAQYNPPPAAVQPHYPQFSQPAPAPPAPYPSSAMQPGPSQFSQPFQAPRPPATISPEAGPSRSSRSSSKGKAARWRPLVTKPADDVIVEQRRCPHCGGRFEMNGQDLKDHKALCKLRFKH
ncbi:hypothetical protein C8R43DRAFT_1135792 [Mycena crocata]|nr:hypothetical protein C8R43DRAFT_1135792 [Mycena crocata]